jgi:hypothetical protein
MLIAADRPADAKLVWDEGLKVAGVEPRTTADSLIWDGGFEAELLQGGFAWRYRPVDDVEVSFDPVITHSGGRSLRVAFPGTANTNFDNLWQYVAVEPNTTYRFGAYIRTDELTTDSGIRFYIDEVGNPDNQQRTPNVIGTQPWAFDEVEWTTGPSTRLLRIVMRRRTSDKLANRVRGTVWVDDVALTPVAARNGRTQ